MTTEVMIPEQQQIQEGITDLSTQALAVIVTDAESYGRAGQLLILHKEMKKQIETFFKPHKENAHKAWKALCNAETAELVKLDPGMKHLNKVMVEWQTEQEHIRREEQARLEAEARKAEEERRLQEALEAEKNGDKETAEAILAQDVFTPPPVVESAVPKMAGLASRTNWKWRIKDEKLIPREYLCVDSVKINGIVRALKSATKISGIEVYPEATMTGARK